MHSSPNEQLGEQLATPLDECGLSSIRLRKAGVLGSNPRGGFGFQTSPPMSRRALSIPRERLGYRSLPNTSPPWDVPRERQVTRLILLRMNRTLPSHRAAFTPW